MKKFILAVFFMMAAQSTLADGKSLPKGSENRLSMVHHSTMVEKYNAIESRELRISLDDDLNGFIEGKVCDACKDIRVIITPETKAYANKVEVPLNEAGARIGRYATVIYEVETNRVSFIRW